MKIVNITNHKLTVDQLEDLKSSGVTEIIELPETFKEAWGSMNPANWKFVCNDIEVFTKNIGAEVCLIAGYTPAVVYLANSDLLRNVHKLYSHSDRVSVEKHNEDGTVVKTNVFKHVGFYDILTGEVF